MEVKAILFSEIYGSYFQVISTVLSEAVDGSLTEKRLDEIVKDKAFDESIFNIPWALKRGDWPLIKEDLTTPLLNNPTMPLTNLQKRWLKALLLDPRIRLFDVGYEGLEDVEPLYTQNMFRYFDRSSKKDPYDDEEYRYHFQIILEGLREKRKVFICVKDHFGIRKKYVCIPYKLEYSSKQDKFRLLAFSGKDMLTVDVARIQCCQLRVRYEEEPFDLQLTKKETMVLKLVDQKKTLERVLLHFSHLEKETVRTDENHYKIILRYDKNDEMELIIRVMSFGPTLQIMSPDRCLGLIREKLKKQQEISTADSEIMCYSYTES